MEQQFLSCDWGTSSFRLRLVDAVDASILAELETADGILKTYLEWQQLQLPGNTRLDFYRSVLGRSIKELTTQVNDPLTGLPVIVSGMASANIGIMELPYKALPVFADGSNLITKMIPADSGFAHHLLLISGIRTDDDVMRGEEIQLAGVVSGNTAEQVFVFPGTHSKHIWVKDGQIKRFSTYMTGEFFELLSRRSILSGSVEEDPGIADQVKTDAFRKGVEAAVNSSLLHTCFTVRTNQLLGGMPKGENYYYLSGILIGNEMQELGNSDIPVTIVANEDKQGYYTLAAEILGLSKVSCQSISTAIVKGHAAMYALHKQALV